MTRTTAFVALPLVMILVGCGASIRTFPLQETLWQDDDQQPFGPRPEVVYNPYLWDTVDNTIFRQAAEVFTYEVDREATNVNALDEVPSSSWFTNRLSRHPMSREELLLGPCPTLEQPPFPWRLVRGKGDGSSPGAVIEAADGNTYVFKVDFRQPERATASDAIVVRLLHAIGYNSPCNQVVFFDPSNIELDPDARLHGRPYTREDFDALIAAAGEGPDGLRRASLSLYIEGVPLGGWRFDGRRDDDPNDVIDHQHRRETRGMYVMSSWLNHIDSRAENNMSAWIETGEGIGYVRHYVLDAGDSFGITWEEDGMARRFGHGHYLDLQHVIEEFLTLGLIERAWTHPEQAETFDVFSYYPNVRDYVPDQWRNGYPNPSFERRTERDMAWMARIISRFRRPDLRAIVQLGRWSDPRLEEVLLRTLWARRDRVLGRWLTRLSPLADPEVSGGRLCLTDLAVSSRIRRPERRHYRARAHAASGQLPIGSEWTIDDARVCMPLPTQSPEGDAAYLIVDVVASTDGRETTRPLRVHLYERPNAEGEAFAVAGLERPNDDSRPEL